MAWSRRRTGSRRGWRGGEVYVLEQGGHLLKEHSGSVAPQLLHKHLPNQLVFQVTLQGLAWKLVTVPLAVEVQNRLTVLV